MLRPKLNRIWTSANSVLRRDPGDAKYLQGWVSEIPTFQVLNFLQYKVDTTMLAQAERGIFEWGSDVSYVLGSLAWDEVDKKIYVSTVGAPDKNLRPGLNLTQWTPSSIQVPRADYDTIVAAINAHIANKANPHGLTAGQLGSYTKAETDALVAQYQAMVQAHSSNKNNPHGVTALQVGAVPALGGTYVGDVTFNGGMYFDAGKVNQISKTGGLYLQADSAVLGIDAVGTPVVGTTASKSPIVSEENFPALKAGQERNYAVPAPTYSADFAGSINIRNGVGMNYTIAGTQEPTYDVTLGNALWMPNAPLETQLRSTEGAIFADSTIAIDLYVGVAGASTEGVLSIGTHTPSVSGKLDTLTLILYGNRAVSAERGYNSGAIGEADKYELVAAANGTIPVGRWCRVVGTFGGAEICIYVDGVLLGRKTNGTLTSVRTNSLRATAYNIVQTSGNYKTRVRNLSIWDSALTDKQVSTL